ncbi:MAG: Bax inhibitor-1/YccA family protein [Alphaproteobacteria bacterium]|nr:Bax inhibitor-1/YccA family protein [Alphaproteobacteria bacterium]
MVDPFIRAGNAPAAAHVSYDAGLRAHMQRVFNYMAGGLAITGALAYLVANTALAGIIFGTPLQYVVMFAPLVFMIYMNVKMSSISAAKAQTLFWLFCGTMGLSMAAIFMVFTGVDITRAFFITAATFGGMSLWGYTTKANLSGFGSFLMMGVVGLMIASLVNLFVASSMLQWIVSVVGVLIFTGLTAYDVQNIKQTYDEGWGREANNKLAVFGALRLYLDFINAFQFILSLTGGRRD